MTFFNEEAAPVEEGAEAPSESEGVETETATEEVAEEGSEGGDDTAAEGE